MCPSYYSELSRNTDKAECPGDQAAIYNPRIVRELEHLINHIRLEPCLASDFSYEDVVLHLQDYENSNEGCPKYFNLNLQGKELLKFMDPENEYPVNMLELLNFRKSKKKVLLAFHIFAAVSCVFPAFSPISGYPLLFGNWIPIRSAPAMLRQTILKLTRLRYFSYFFSLLRLMTFAAVLRFYKTVYSNILLTILIEARAKLQYTVSMGLEEQAPDILKCSLMSKLTNRFEIDVAFEHTGLPKLQADLRYALDSFKTQVGDTHIQTVRAHGFFSNPLGAKLEKELFNLWKIDFYLYLTMPYILLMVAECILLLSTDFPLDYSSYLITYNTGHVALNKIFSLFFDRKLVITLGRLLVNFLAVKYHQYLFESAEFQEKFFKAHFYQAVYIVINDLNTRVERTWHRIVLLNTLPYVKGFSNLS